MYAKRIDAYYVTVYVTPISQVYLKFDYFCWFSSEILILFQNLNNCLCFSKEEYLLTTISGKNAVREPKAGVNETKICPKPKNWAKITNISIYNAIIQILFNFSTYFCASQIKHIWAP